MRGWVFVGMFGLGLTAGSAASAQPVNIAGTWHVAGEAVAGAITYTAYPTCEFEQVGERVSGTCIGPNATGPLSGVVSGRSVSWSWTHRATTLVGLSGVTNFNGTYINSHLIRGAMSAADSPVVGSFTQTR